MNEPNQEILAELRAIREALGTRDSHADNLVRRAIEWRNAHSEDDARFRAKYDNLILAIREYEATLASSETKQPAAAAGKPALQEGPGCPARGTTASSLEGSLDQPPVSTEPWAWGIVCTLPENKGLPPIRVYLTKAEAEKEAAGFGDEMVVQLYPASAPSPVRAALERLCEAGESVQETRYWESAADPAGASVRSFQALEQLRAALASARETLKGE